MSPTATTTLLLLLLLAASASARPCKTIFFSSYPQNPNPNPHFLTLYLTSTSNSLNPNPNPNPNRFFLIPKIFSSRLLFHPIQQEQDQSFKKIQSLFDLGEEDEYPIKKIQSFFDLGEEKIESFSGLGEEDEYPLEKIESFVGEERGVKSFSELGDMPLRVYSSVRDSMRERSKDIMSVVGALLFGMGCGALTAATMYLVWSLFMPNRFEFEDSDDEFDSFDDLYDQKGGYVAIPSKVVDDLEVKKGGDGNVVKQGA